jgi:predicted nucleotidyltransferase
MDNQRTGKDIIPIIEKYSLELSRIISISGVYLFGSYAGNNFNEYSDIDVLVVSPDFLDDPVEDLQLLMKLRRKIDRRIEPHPVTPEEFAKGNPFLDQIKKDLIQVA